MTFAVINIFFQDNTLKLILSDLYFDALRLHAQKDFINIIGFDFLR